MIKKSELQILLQKLAEPKYPKPSLEQYTITGNLAAEILNLAYLHDDIKDKIVFDFGCGSGRLAIGAALLGAKLVIGIDIDKNVIKVAKENLKRHEIYSSKKLPVFFVICDIRNWFSKADTIIQNPPFGIKTRHADRIFIEAAIKCGRRIYTLHRNGRKKTRTFLKNFIEKFNARVEKILKYEFILPHIFKFHEKPKVKYFVDLYVVENLNKS
ncbi:MAG: METTL5 family protein [Candidatus Aenigmatarchaeota archaeon]